MTSVVSGGTTARIAARILFKALWAGSGRSAKYSSTVFRARLDFAAAFAFFMSMMLPGLWSKSNQLTTNITAGPRLTAWPGQVGQVTLINRQPLMSGDDL